MDGKLFWVENQYFFSFSLNSGKNPREKKGWSVNPELWRVNDIGRTELYAYMVCTSAQKVYTFCTLYIRVHLYLFVHWYLCVRLCTILYCTCLYISFCKCLYKVVHVCTCVHVSKFCYFISKPNLWLVVNCTPGALCTKCTLTNCTLCKLCYWKPSFVGWKIASSKKKKFEKKSRSRKLYLRKDFE